MSSLRNAVQRRNHKERSQPKEREKWGLLEKHKDYSLRAQDYNEKKKRLKILRHKAAERNPDEFHFAMMSSSTRDGGVKVAKRGNPVLSHDVVKLLKTQDTAYIRTTLQKTRKARAKVEQQFVLSDTLGAEEQTETMSGARKRHHLVFVDSSVEQREQNLKNRVSIHETDLAAEEGLDVKDFTLGRVQGEQSIQSPTPPVPKTETEAELGAAKLKKLQALQKQFQRERDVRQSALQSLRLREKGLATAEQELEIQRGQMTNSVGGTTKSGQRFKIRQRKR